jgi:hypothetical protein
MKRFLFGVIFGIIILSPTYLYVYSKGMVDGVAHYRRSDNFKLTLFSMFVAGVHEACRHLYECGGTR